MISYRQPFTGSYPITQNFGEKIDGVTYKNKPHTGIDYGMPEGTAILASADGRVLKTGYEKGGYGNYVIIMHPDMSGTVYAHLSKIFTYPGAKVNAGEIIGESGSSGYVTGPHLHFEWRGKADDITTAEDPTMHLQSVLDQTPINNTTEPEKPQFEPVEAGLAVVVCDVANVRCHCDMARVITTLKKGDLISITDKVTMYNGIPYRDFWHIGKACWLRIAEHDNWDQILRNCDSVPESIPEGEFK